MAQLEIVTERMKIVEFEMKHITTEYISWLNDKNLMKYSEQRRRSHTFESSSSYLLSFKNSSNMFIALENLEGDLLGTITIFHDLNNSIIDMGILIGAKNSRGKGFGAEAWKAVTNWVILNLRPRKLTAGCLSVNKAMIKLMTGIEMQPECIRKKTLFMEWKRS